jgi:serine/threonine protein kinase
MDDLVGRTIGPYTLVEPLGQGGMATVYKGYQQSLNRYVAIKVLRGDLARDEKFVARFRREALAVARLSHPSILHVYDAGAADGIYYIVMDYAPGGTLKDLLRRGPLAIERALSIAEQIAEALDYAHRQGVIHRDVKPSNILLTVDGRPQLTDFGIAKALYEHEQLTRTGTSIGTPEYMAPEQIDGQSVDGRADIYALGIVLYEMLSGRTPFHAETPMALVYKQLNDPPPPLRSVGINVPGWLEGVLNKALAKNPAARFQRASDLARALHSEAPTGTQPWPAPPQERHSPSPIPMTAPVTRQRPASRRRSGAAVWLLVALIAVLLLGLAGGATLLLSNSRQNTSGGVVTLVVTSEVVTQVVTPAPVWVTPTNIPQPQPTAPAATPASEWDIPSLQANIESLRFFEGPQQQPPHEGRVYSQRFAQSKARYIYYELNLEYAEHSQAVDFVLDVIYRSPDGSVFAELTGNHRIEADWTSSWHSKGWGWSDPGKWPIGTYRVEMYVAGELVATGSFEID